MDFLKKEREENNPYVQLLIMAAYALGGALITSIIGIVIIVAMYGPGILSSPEALAGADARYIPGLKILQITVFIGLFLAPPLLLAVTEKRKVWEFYNFKKPQWKLLALITLLMACSMPVMEWITMFNQKMVFPDFLKPVEGWMRQKEDDALKMTFAFLTMKSLGDFMVNIFMIAILPGIGEELMFRGGIQRSFQRIFGSPHVAIWLAAFIFSVIHLQFYGFFPRLLLGAAFGYIYFWSGSLWYAMFAHFLNNAYAVCVAWYLQRNNLPLNEESTTANFQWYGYAISLIATVFLFIYFKNKTTRNYGKQLD